MEASDEFGREPGNVQPEAMTAPPPGATGREGGVELDIGPRVTAVFTAAEKAAQHIVDMAREEAEDVRRRAQAEADSVVTQRRYEAEEEAARLLAEARSQAEGIRAAAAEDARQIEESARRRELRIREETRLLEERVDWALAGLRDVAERLREADAHFTLPVPRQPGARRVEETAREEPERARSGTDVPTTPWSEPAGVEPGDEFLEVESEAGAGPDRVPADRPASEQDRF